LHNQGLIEVLQAGEVETDRFGGQVMQASGILWGLQETFPGTLGADIAAGESIVMLEDWDDELLVERANQISCEESLLSGCRSGGPPRDGTPPGS
jgi:hypothetical protein